MISALGLVLAQLDWLCEGEPNPNPNPDPIPNLDPIPNPDPIPSLTLT